VTGLRVERVDSRPAWRDFLAVPRQVYRDDPLRVPPIDAEVRRTLDPARNPYFREARLERFVAYRGREPVARACAVVSRAHLRRFGRRTAFFGFFESADDDEAAERLLDRVGDWCRESGAEELGGPFNPNHYSELGLQVSGFDAPPAFFEPRNPPYYVRLLESNGFAVVKRLHTRANPDVGAYLRGRYGAVERPRRRGDFRVRPFRLRETRRELERIRSVYNDAFADNWHFLPLSAAEYAFLARGLLLVSRPHLLALVEYRGEPVGVAQCALDVNPLLRRLDGRSGPMGAARFLLGRRTLRDVVLFAAGIRADFRSTEAYRLLVEYLFWALRDCRVMTTTWMTDDNPAAIGGALRFGLEPSKRFVVYGRRL
jgi:hypothetical protein